MLKTSDLKPGDVVRLLSYGEMHTHYRDLLMTHGLIRGQVVRVIRRAWGGCPIEFEVGGVLLMLRVQEAAVLEWEYVVCVS